jgi:endonuclease YncB( thermonuclease family)
MNRFAFPLLLLLSLPAQADLLQGQVVAITDGDRVVLLDAKKQRHKIRLAGIDAPEKVQAFGSKSTANLGRLAFNKNAVAECPKTDRYGRLVCKVTVAGQDVGLQQVKDGIAWWYRKYAVEQSPQDQADYEQAETWAKMRRQGLWNDVNPTPPWEWRRGEQK